MSHDCNKTKLLQKIDFQQKKPDLHDYLQSVLIERILNGLLIKCELFDLSEIN